MPKRKLLYIWIIIILVEIFLLFALQQGCANIDFTGKQECRFYSFIGNFDIWLGYVLFLLPIVICIIATVLWRK